MLLPCLVSIPDCFDSVWKPRHSVVLNPFSNSAVPIILLYEMQENSIIIYSAFYICKLELKLQIYMTSISPYKVNNKYNFPQ